MHEASQLPCVRWITPDDGHRRCPKHVGVYDKNKFWILMHLVGYFYEILEIIFILIILGALAETRRVTVKFSCLSNRSPSASTNNLAQADEFSWNSLFEYFRRCVDKAQVSLKPGNDNGTLLEELVNLWLTSRWILLRMENVLDKRCSKNQNTHFMFVNFFPKIVLFVR
jgi:hypothetical protein